MVWFHLLSCAIILVVRNLFVKQGRRVQISYGTRPISIVVMQQFSKLQRTVQFCYWALNYLEFLDSSICVCRQVVRQESAKLLSSVRFWPDTFNPVEFDGINLIQNRLTGRTPPFEGVYLGSNPSSGTSPVDGIGIHTCLRNKVLQVRVLYRAFHWTQWNIWSNVVSLVATCIQGLGVRFSLY